MKNSILILLCFAAIAGSGCSTTRKSPGAALQGTWSGREIGATPATPRHLVFSGERFDYRGAQGDDWGKGTFTVHEEAQPKQLRVSLTKCGPKQYVGKTSVMIYEVKDGTLTISANEPGNPAAPLSFDAQGARHMVFKKESP